MCGPELNTNAVSLKWNNLLALIDYVTRVEEVAVKGVEVGKKALGDGIDLSSELVEESDESGSLRLTGWVHLIYLSKIVQKDVSEIWVVWSQIHKQH